MPEINKCRDCALCCKYCIFLDYDKKTKKYGCLIYNNKYRMPVSDHTVDNDKFLEIIEQIIIEEQKDRNKVCHNFICSELKEEKRTKKESLSVNSSRRYLTLLNEDLINTIQENKRLIRKYIPNFEDLVEILNS